MQWPRPLRRAGYRILARNVRTPRGEVDVLAVERRHLVVVEVKTTATDAGLPPVVDSADASSADSWPPVAGSPAATRGVACPSASTSYR